MREAGHTSCYPTKWFRKTKTGTQRFTETQRKKLLAFWHGSKWRNSALQIRHGDRLCMWAGRRQHGRMFQVQTTMPSPLRDTENCKNHSV